MKHKKNKSTAHRNTTNRLKVWAVIIFMIALCLSPVSGSSQNETQTDVLDIVYLPLFGKTQTLKVFSPLTKHLEKELGTPVNAVSFDTYEQTLAHLARGNFDLAYLSPAVYVSASSYTKLTVLAIELDADGNPGYRSVLICKDKSWISTPKDIKGKVLAFTEVGSTSGFLVPLNFFLMEMNTTPATLASKIIFAGSHGDVVTGVANGAFDVGATNNMDMKRFINENDLDETDFRIIWESELIPGSPVCANSALPLSQKEKILEALLKVNYNKKDLEAMKIGGFKAALEKNFDLVKQLHQMKH